MSEDSSAATLVRAIKDRLSVEELAEVLFVRERERSVFARDKIREGKTHPDLEIARSKFPPRILIRQLVRALNASNREDLPPLVPIKLANEVRHRAPHTEYVRVLPRADVHSVRDGGGGTGEGVFERVGDRSALFEADGAVGEAWVVRAAEEVGGGGEGRGVEKGDIVVVGGEVDVEGSCFSFALCMWRRVSTGIEGSEKGSGVEDAPLSCRKLLATPNA